MTAKKNDKGSLTQKQARFVELILMGCSPSDAYRGAYNAKGSSPETVAVEAWRLLHRNPNVTQMIQQGRAEAMEAAITTRSTLINRMEQVNLRAFDKLTAEDAERVDYSALQAFLKTYEVLARNTPDDSFYAVAGSELTAQCNGDWTKAVFSDEHVWFAQGDAALPDLDTWDSETVEPLPDGGTRITKKRIR